MQLITKLITTILSVLAFVSLTTASPIADAAAVKRSVATGQFTVKITAPASGDFWVSPFKNTVKWDTSTIPPEAENDDVSILIGYYDDNNVEHVNHNTPLASGVQLSSGSQVVTTPNVTSLSTNFIVLFDNSSNRSLGTSPTFTIAQ